MTYINAVKYILSLPDLQSDGESIERMRIICDILGNPQKKLKTIHACGDVGKDSCLTMLEAILKHTHYKSGRCSISNIEDPRECISINNKAISHSEFCDIAKDLSGLYKTKFKKAVPSVREIMTLIAVIYFANNGCDIAIFERSVQKNDPVSIIETPLISLLTPFSEREITDGRFEYLIPKGTSETVSSPQHKEIFNSVSGACVMAGSRLTVPIYSDLEINGISLFKTDFSYRGESYSIRSFSPCQTFNAITTIEVINAMARCGFSLGTNETKKGLFTASLVGKCEAISIEPTVIVSSSYETDRIDSLVASLAQIKEQFSKKIEVYADSDCKIDLFSFSESLSTHEIPHNTPIAISLEKAEVQAKNSFSLSPDSAVLFIGSKKFISKVKFAFNERL